MGMRDLFRRRSAQKTQALERVSSVPLSMQAWADMFGSFSFNGVRYPLMHVQGGIDNRQEAPDGTFQSYVRLIYKQSGVVFACIATRMLLFSEARFQFRQRTNGRPGRLFGTPSLARLERPWPTGTTGDLLARMEQDVSLAGNAYIARRGNGLRRLRPDWVTIVAGTEEQLSEEEMLSREIDWVVLGYIYHPGGRHSGIEPISLLASEVAHYAPIPDPEANYRGMSWLTPVIREILGDKATTDHKLAFFENGAQLTVAIKLDISDPDKFDIWVEKFKEKHEGVDNAYRTLFLSAGADAVPIGVNLKDLDFSKTQGHGETRIAAAAGVPPIIVGLSEGLEAATYSNYGQACRRFTDGTLRPLWRNAAASLQNIIETPAGAELWYDDRDIAFLKQDQKDAAEVFSKKAQAIRQLTDAGFEPETVVAAVEADDMNLLQHTGLYSVQLQPPGAGNPPAPTPPPAT